MKGGFNVQSGMYTQAALAYRKARRGQKGIKEAPPQFVFVDSTVPYDECPCYEFHESGHECGHECHDDLRDGYCRPFLEKWMRNEA
jgi:hypothetical protein